jgi:cytoskeleton protein RodZ
MILLLCRVEFYTPAAPRSRRLGLPSFGEKLKLEREKRKVTLEQISVSTKIGTRMLRALEENQFNQLPGGIFNKGFVRAYSRVLGLDEEQTVADYLQASGDAPPARADTVSPEPTTLEHILHHNGGDDKSHQHAARQPGPSETEENILRMEAEADAPGHQLPWGVFAALLLVVALTLSLWSRYERERGRRAVQSVSNTAALPVSQSPRGASDFAASSSSGPSPTSGSSSTGSSSNGATSSNKDRESGGSRIVSSTPSSTAVLAHTSLTAAQTTAGDFSLLVQAREESWITITSDGKPISSELLPAGSERQVRGHQQIVVKTGNAGGVDFQFNGKKVIAAGEYGEVKTITFGPRGLM